MELRVNKHIFLSVNFLHSYIFATPVYNVISHIKLIYLGTVTSGFDCIVIPGAEKQADGVAVTGTKICGRDVGLVTGDATDTNATVCSE